MAALTNTQKADDTVAGLDIEFVENFNKEFSRLTDILGIFGAEPMKAGAALYQYVVTGELNDAEVAEGDETPLSKFKVEKKFIGEMEPKPYRKLTSAKAVLKGGFVNSVAKTDDKMQKLVRRDRMTDFFKAIQASGKSTCRETLQAVLAQVDAKLNDELELRGDATERIIHFVNRFDIADYLGNANVSTQTAYGMTYIQSFLGVTDIFVTSQVPRGHVFATPVENITIYGIDFAELDTAGLSYEVSDGGLIGVHHEPAYNRTSCETYVLTGMTVIPEVVNYIVEGTLGKLDDMTVDQLKAFAEKNGIDLGDKTTKADILAVVKAAD